MHLTCVEAWHAVVGLKFKEGVIHWHSFIFIDSCMGCSASAQAGSSAAKKTAHVNPSTAMKELAREFRGTDAWGFEKSSASRESLIEGSDHLWTLNERTLAQKYSLEWLLKRKKVEQFMLSIQRFGVPFVTVVACIQLFQEGAGWPHHTPALTESLFVKSVFVSAFPSFIVAPNCLLHPFCTPSGIFAALQRSHSGFGKFTSLVI